MILTNCTDSQRGLSLSKGIKILEAREMWQVPLEQQDEIRALFRSRSFQRFVDTKVFLLSTLGDDAESTVVATPKAPETLTQPAHVDGLQTPVGTGTGQRAKDATVVAYQQGGEGTDAQPAKAAKSSKKK